MSLIKYNKLVRDKIPQIIEQDNKKCTLEPVQYLFKRKKKW